MSDQPSLEARIAALEQATAAKSPTAQKHQMLAALGLLLFCALVSLNCWLVYVHFEQMAKADVEHLFWVVCHSGSTQDERTDAFLRLVAAGNTEWKSARLSHLQLEGADLAGIDLGQARLENCKMSRANLAGVQLDGGSLQLTDLTEAGLSNANLVETDLLKATLNQANLRAANLRGAILEQTKAQEVNLVLADLTEAHLPLSDLSGANLTGANLTGANLEAATLKGTNLALTRLADTKLVDADFTDSNWWRARGLNLEQIAEFKSKFAPSKNADPDRQNDYRLWLQSAGSK